MSEWSLVTSAIFSTVLVILLFTGIMGNILVGLVTTRRKTRLLPGGVFIRSLSISDAGGSATILFMFITTICRGEWVFGHVGCQISGTLIVFFGSSSLHLLCIISVNHYLKIAKRSLYRRVFGGAGTRLFLVIPWVLPLMMSVAPVFGWSAHDYQFSKCICHFYFSTSISFTLTFLLGVVAIPLSISTICYFNMYYLIKNHAVSMKNLQQKNPTLNIEEIRSTRIIFALVVAFILCYTPGSIINILEMAGSHVPSILDLISITLIVSKHSLNPLLYGLLNRRYRKEALNIVREISRSCCCRKLCSIAREEDESQSKRKINFAGNTTLSGQRSHSIDSNRKCAKVVRHDNSLPSSNELNSHSCETHPRVVVLCEAS